MAQVLEAANATITHLRVAKNRQNRVEVRETREDRSNLSQRIKRKVTNTKFS